MMWNISNLCFTSCKGWCRRIVGIPKSLGAWQRKYHLITFLTLCCLPIRINIFLRNALGRKFLLNWEKHLVSRFKKDHRMGIRYPAGDYYSSLFYRVIGAEEYFFKWSIGLLWPVKYINCFVRGHSLIASISGHIVSRNESSCGKN